MLVFFYNTEKKIIDVRFEDQVVTMYIAKPNLKAVPPIETCNTRK